MTPRVFLLAADSDFLRGLTATLIHRGIALKDITARELMAYALHRDEAEKREAGTMSAAMGGQVE